MSMDFARQEGLTIFSFDNMCKMYSGTTTVTSGSGDVTVNLPFDWTDGVLIVYSSETTTDYVSNAASGAVRYETTYDALTDSTFTDGNVIKQITNTTSTSNIASADSSDANIGQPKSATTTSFTLNDPATGTRYIKYFVYAPYTKTIALGNADSVNIDSGMKMGLTGYTQSHNHQSGYIFASRMILAKNSVINHILLATTSSNSGNMKAALYDDSSNAPNNLLYTTDAVAVDGVQDYMQFKLSFSNSIELDAGVYWLATLSDSDIYVQAAFGSTTNGKYKSGSYSTGFPDPFGTPAGNHVSLTSQIY